MGGQTPQSGAASDIQAAMAGSQEKLLNMTLPEIQRVLGMYLSDLGAPGSEPSSVRAMYDQGRTAVNQNFQQAEAGTNAAISTRAREMGLDYRPQAIESAQLNAQRSLEQQRGNALQNLSFQEAGAGLQQTDLLLSRMGNIERMLASGGLGLYGNALQDTSMMSQVDPMGAALGGAASGAALGTSISPGYGTVIGALAGGAYGYFSSGG